jgi:F-actin capping protein, beta subunit
MLGIETETAATGTLSLGGSLTRQEEQEFPVNAHNPHVSNMGKVVYRESESFSLELERTCLVYG